MKLAPRSSRLPWSALATMLATAACSANSSSLERPSDAGSDQGSVSTRSVAPDAGTEAGATKGVDVGGPPVASGSKTSAAATHNFAVHRLYLGDSDRNPAFPPDTKAWEQIGYNLDGLITTKTSTDVCTPFTKGSTGAQVDGNEGIDNAFGSQIVNGILDELGESLSSSVSGQVASGAFTLEFDTTGIATPTGTSVQTNQGLEGQLFVGMTYDGTPPTSGDSFEITDSWPVTGSLLAQETAPFQSKIQFPAAYITNGTWVSGSPTTLTLDLTVKGQTLALVIHAAVITLPVSADASGQLHGTGGVIAGVLRTSELVSALNTVAGGVGSGEYCSLIEGFLPDFENASDIIINDDGSVTNTAGTPCNGISIGLGFDADEVAQPSVIGPAVEAGAPMPCGSGT